MHATFPMRLLPWLLAALFAWSTPASAQYARMATAGGACHPANGMQANKFNRTMFTLTNLATTDQYVICQFQMEDYNPEPMTQIYLIAHLDLTQGGTATCSAQVGSYLNAHLTIRSSATLSGTVAPGDPTYLPLSFPTLGRVYPYEILALQCKLPPGGRMGLLQRSEVRA